MDEKAESNDAKNTEKALKKPKKKKTSSNK
jgi:hypothetical protein